MRSTKAFIVCAVCFTVWTNYGQISEGKTFIDWNNIEMPVSPNAASLGTYGDTPVNTATGLPNISIPIYTLQVDGVSVPISLSYHASGIQVNELATAVGLKWTLNAGGGIFRSVSGKPDEDGWLRPQDDLGPVPNSFYEYYDNDITNENYQNLMLGGFTGNGYAKMRDHNPDSYNYSFLGYSGKYITDFYNEVIKNQADNLKIDGNTIEDQSGNTYNFGQNEYTENSNKTFIYASYRTGGSLATVNGYSYDSDIITGWMLTTINTKNNKTISFQYESYQIVESTPHILSNTIAYAIGVCGLQNSKYAEMTSTDVYNDYTVQLVKKISSDNVDILFDYSNPDPSLSTWQKKLNKITINDKVTGTSKEFHFEYDKYGNDPRLKLERVYEKKGTLELPGYSFGYVEGDLPKKYSFSQDFFGYFNGKANFSLAPKDSIIKGYFPYFKTFYDNNTGDRSHSSNHLQIGVLDLITYPTGGSTKFTYGPNAENDNGILRYCGGLRVNKIENRDSDENVLKTTGYTYEGLVGQSFKTDQEKIIKTDEPNLKYIFHSGFVEREDLSHSGYFYRKVTTLVLKDGKKQKKESNFIENTSFGTLGNLLSSEIIYSGNNIAKLVEYQYGRFGTNEAMSWNILGGMHCIPKPTFPPEAPQGYMGYGLGVKVTYTGNWAMLPTMVTTTDYLKQGSTNEAVTTVQYNNYDDETLLKEIEMLSTRYTRENDGSLTISNTDGEELLIYYKYPWSPEVGLNLPAGLPMGKEVWSSRNTSGAIFGQAYEYDGVGNIKKTFEYNKGEIGNNSTLGYVDDYEQMSSFIYENGNPVQMSQKNGVATSYIWGYNGQYPVAKIEGKALAGLNSTLVGQIKAQNNESALRGLLTQLRNDPTTANAMVTTYTYEPLNGVKTITDPKGDKNTFNYDSFGRLLQVKDKDEKILSENEYNYAPH